MSPQPFVHLRAATHHSLTEGLLDVKQLVNLAKQNGHPAVALTNLGTMSVALEFVGAAKKAGIKPILGVDAWIEPDLTQPGADLSEIPPNRLLLLAENNEGYQRIMALLGRANAENIKTGSDGEERAYIKQSWLKEDCKGIVALTGDPQTGEVTRALIESPQNAVELLNIYKDIFGDRIFLEVSRYAHEKEYEWVRHAAALSLRTGVPIVATHGVLFGTREDFFPHEVHSSIVRGKQVVDPDYEAVATRERYYTSTEEMEELFSDIPQALENARRLASRLNVDVEVGVNHLPDFPLPEGETDLNEYFAKLSRQGLEARLEKIFPDPAERAAKRGEYDQRIDREINTIIQMGFPGYFLVVSDFIRWSKAQGIPVGPGRGSGAGSLVAYSLNITDLDPIQHGLLFERFLNPERVSMPDIDVDFCRDRRDETIQYLFEKYGQEAVSQISTFGTLAAKAAVLGAGRALNYPIPRVREITKRIPDVLDITLKDALEDPRFREIYDSAKDARRLIDLAIKIEGTSQSTGVHPGGVIIAPGRIDKFAPTMRSKKGVMVTQFDAASAEQAGLIKFDLLGVKNLTLIDRVQKMVNARPERKNNPVIVEDIPLNDDKALALLREGDTYGVFQLESPGMRRLLRELRPDRFADVVAIEALYRPGPMAQIPTFIEGKRNPDSVVYPHPDIKDILEETYGVIVYQEQVMQIAQRIGGYSLGGADLLRRAMGKKDAEKMAQERAKFIEGAKARGYGEEVATSLFDLMEKFASYGFNKSHAAAYAMLSMQTAWFKAHYPVEFFTAYMNVEIDSTNVLAQAVADAKLRKLEILPPDINLSEALFKAVHNPDGTSSIRYGLAALKSVSQAVANDIVAAREAYGDFESIPDFLTKVNDYLRSQSRNVSLKQVTQALISAGAFDSINPNRAFLSEQAKLWSEYISKLNKRKGTAKGDGEIFMPALWSALGKEPVPAPVVQKKGVKPLDPPEDPTNIEPWNDIEKLNNEAKVVGFYITGHPYQAYAEQIGGLSAALPVEKIDTAIEDGQSPYEPVLIAGVVESFREYTPASGKSMAFLSINDGTAVHDATMFNDTFLRDGEKVEVGKFIALEANIRPPRKAGETSCDVLVNAAYTLSETESLLAQTINVLLPADRLPELHSLISQHPVRQRTGENRAPTLDNELGSGQFGPGAGVRVWLPLENDLATVELPDRVDASPAFLEKLRNTFPNCVEVAYSDRAVFAPEAPRATAKPKDNSRRPRP